MNSSTRVAAVYVTAKLTVLSAGFGSEIVWQRSRSEARLTEAVLLREIAWVALSAGMREAIVRSKFPAITKCFFNWESASRIAAAKAACVESACKHFGHKPKIEAIAEAARIIHVKGFDALQQEIIHDPLSTLQQFPYIGPVTKYHVAKNLGIAVAKPDRHLARIASACGYVDAQALCEDISRFIGDPVDVVDVVLWRFCTMTGSRNPFFALACPGNA